MKKFPYLISLSIISVAILLILNWNLRPRAGLAAPAISISQAQTMVATGMNNIPQLTEANKIASEYLAKDSQHAQALFVKAWAQQRLGMIEESKKTYQTLFPLLQEYGKFGHFNIAVLFEATGDNVSALKHLQTSVMFEPQLDFAWARAARILARTEKKEEAKRMVAEGLKVNPESQELLALQKEYSGK